MGTREKKIDITDRKDIELLVDRFYEKVKSDPVLAPHFSQVDWATHLPTMYKFWASMILGEQSYQGNPFQKHLNRMIDTTHFHTWKKIFYETVDENFIGDNADGIKLRAQNIAGVFQHKMNLI